ncbi:MAG: acetoin utilization protein AcuC [Coriobacteriia bacterium]
MRVAYAFDPSLGSYGLGPGHPMRPERVLRTASLIGAYGLVRPGALEPIGVRAADDAELLLVHDAEYLDAVKRASRTDGPRLSERGIGSGDTPPFAGMHDAAALVAGATTGALKAVTEGRFVRAFSPAGGLHHAHRDRAAGFCVYNDPAVAIAAALEREADLRVLYLDIDAHHGDGVQEAFYEDPRVLTLSLHEDGRYLYPGTGSFRERGRGPGTGSAINVPLPPYATPACFMLAFAEVVVPAARAFSPDVIVAQCGADSHWTDPLTTLGMTLEGFEALFGRIVELSETVCSGRLVACGGGGYSWEHVVPRAWTLLAGALLGVPLGEDLPAAWREKAGIAEGPPRSLRDDPPAYVPEAVEAELLRDTRLVAETLHGLGVARP